MGSFQKLFVQAKGNSISFKGKELYLVDKFPIQNGCVIECILEHATVKPKMTQGFCIDVTGYVELNGKIIKKGKGIRLNFWENDPINKIKIKVFTKSDSIIIYNICELETSYLVADDFGNPITRHNKTITHWIGGAAMIVEEIEGGRRYRCSDTSSAEKPFPFNDIVFTIPKTDSTKLI